MRAPTTTATEPAAETANVIATSFATLSSAVNRSALNSASHPAGGNVTAAAVAAGPAQTKFGDVRSKISNRWAYQSAKPIDFSFKDIAHITDLLLEDPRSGQKTIHTPGQVNTAIRISNNSLTSLADLPKVIEPLIGKFKDLTWLDVSFNHLTTIDAALLQLPSLGVLYLHANQIQNISEVDKLGQLSHLRNLTLHGNPLEQTRGYRSVVLARVPILRHLDFCAITKQDKVVARTFSERLSHAQQNLDNTDVNDA